MSLTQLLLVENDILLRETLVRLLEVEDDLKIAGHCGTPAGALELLEHAHVDVILADAGSAWDIAYEFVSSALEAGFQGKFLLMTSALHLQGSVRALQLGVSGIFIKSGGLDKLLRAIRLVAGGEAWVESDVLQVLASGMGNPFSNLEDEILRGVLDGLTNRSIAERMGVPEATVKSALRRVFRRTGLQTRTQLIRAALEGSLGMK